MADLLTPTSDFDALLDVLPAGWEQLAHKLKAIGTDKSSKIKDPRVLMRALMTHVGCDIPLRQTVAVLAEAEVIDINHVNLHRRMKKAGPLIQELVSRLGARRSEVVRDRWGGYVPILLDGSVVVTPKYNEWNGRLHAAMRLPDQCIVQAHISTTQTGESLKRFSFERGDLAVGDRGFANPVGVQSVLAQGADVLVRVNRSSLPLYAEGTDEALNIHTWVQGLGDNKRTHARPVYTQGPRTARIDGRLIAKRLPHKKRSEARKRARAEFGNDDVALELSEWLILFTTTAKARLSDTLCIELYRLRWQVELLFKRMKSLSNLGALPNHRPESVLTWLGLKVLLYMCAECLAQPPSSPAIRGFSPLFTFRQENALRPELGTTTLEIDESHVAARCGRRASYAPGRGRATGASTCRASVQLPS